MTKKDKEDAVLFIHKFDQLSSLENSFQIILHSGKQRL
jgi:hypothetical protein